MKNNLDSRFSELQHSGYHGWELPCQEKPEKLSEFRRHERIFESKSPKSPANMPDYESEIQDHDRPQLKQAGSHPQTLRPQKGGDHKERIWVGLGLGLGI